MKKFLYKLWPNLCLLCLQKSDTDIAICYACKNDLPVIKNHCLYCAAILKNDIDKICGVCLGKKEKNIKHAFAFLHYEFPVTKLISHLKFNKSLIYANLLGKLMAEQIQIHYQNQNELLPDIIIPVPLHVKRQRERGFNQSIEIAKPIAKALNISLKKFLVRRVIATDPQTTLNAKKREDNLKNAFKCDTDLTNKNVVIFDDVVTTGSTIFSLAECLQKSNAKYISLWCCARN